MFYPLRGGGGTVTRAEAGSSEHSARSTANGPERMSVGSDAGLRGTSTCLGTLQPRRSWPSSWRPLTLKYQGLFLKFCFVFNITLKYVRKQNFESILIVKKLRFANINV